MWEQHNKETTGEYLEVGNKIYFVDLDRYDRWEITAENEKTGRSIKMPKMSFASKDEAKKFVEENYA